MRKAFHLCDWLNFGIYIYIFIRKSQHGILLLQVIYSNEMNLSKNSEGQGKVEVFSKTKRN